MDACVLVRPSEAKVRRQMVAEDTSTERYVPIMCMSTLVGCAALVRVPCICITVVCVYRHQHDDFDGLRRYREIGANHEFAIEGHLRQLDRLRAWPYVFTAQR